MGEVPLSVWLVGLSGAGKSTVGPLLAERLGYRFVDLDTRIEAIAGETIPEVFRRGGESELRRLEAQATRETVGRERVVVACGGGWMARQDIDRTAGGGVRLWLRVRPETAIHRLSEEDIRERPLLEGSDSLATLERLLADREAAYAESELTLETDDLSPEAAVEAVLASLERHATASSTARPGTRGGSRSNA